MGRIGLAMVIVLFAAAMPDRMLRAHRATTA
jgi:hypothetical protein